MKKNLLILLQLLAATALLTFVSCSDDEKEPEVFDKGKIEVKTGTDLLFVEFGWSEEKTFTITTSNIASLKVQDSPEGWNVVLADDMGSIAVTAPASNRQKMESVGYVYLRGQDLNGEPVEANFGIFALDYSSQLGTYLLLEGPLGGNGSVSYIDVNGTLHEGIYEKANDGAQPGSVLTDMYIHNGKTYLLSQNGAEAGGEGHLLIVNSRTFVKERVIDLEFTSVEDVTCWPQHIVVVSDTKAYIQYSTSDWEQNSGARTLDLASGAIASQDLPGTYGAFNSEGATKGRMLFSKDKVFIPCGESVLIFDTANDSSPVEVSLGGIVKGVVKSYEGRIVVPVAGEFTPGETAWDPVEFTTPASIAVIEHDGTIVSRTDLAQQIEFSVSPSQTAIGLCANFTAEEIFFTGGQGFVQTDIYRFNPSSKAADLIVSIDDGVYGYMGHHSQNELTVPISLNYTDAEFRTIKAYDGTPVGTAIGIEGTTPAAVDFAYRFSPDYIKL